MKLNDLEQKIDQAIALLQRSRYTVAFTGAGVSTPSGIPDFRSPDSGLWQQVDPMSVATIYAFRRRPQDFYDWFHPLTRLTMAAEPNAAHLALAQLEKHGPLQGILTQNIDMLHTRAGSQTIHELHGHLREVTCLNCYTIYPSDSFLEAFIATGQAPTCEKCAGILKPNAILFGEQLPVRVWTAARQHARDCDLMLVAGSSLNVAPAGDLPLLARQNGARLIIVNFETTAADHLADVVIHADVVDVLPRLAAPFLPEETS